MKELPSAAAHRERRGAAAGRQHTAIRQRRGGGGALALCWPNNTTTLLNASAANNPIHPSIHTLERRRADAKIRFNTNPTLWRQRRSNQWCMCVVMVIDHRGGAAGREVLALVAQPFSVELFAINITGEERSERCCYSGGPKQTTHMCRRRRVVRALCVCV